jgi:hypothetical protein
MKNSVSNLKKAYQLPKDEVKKLKGGGGCCSPNSPFGIAFPAVCAMFPPCHLQ